MTALLYRLLLLAYPRRFRREYGVAMLELFRIQRRRVRHDRRRLAALRFWLFIVHDLTRNAFAERSRRWTDILFKPRLRPGATSHYSLPPDRFRMLSSLFTEFRHAARRLAHAPAFTLTAVSITALGIGANSAIFSFVDAAMLRPPAYANPDRVVSVYQDSDDGEPSSSSFPAYRDMAAYGDVFDQAAAVLSFGATLVRGDGVEPLSAEWVTSDYFDMLGLRPTLGRDLEPADDIDGGEPVAIISYAAWQGRYGSDPGVLGQRLRINGTPVTVVGIGPRGYGGITPGFQVDLWLSLSCIRPALGDYAGGTLERRADHWFDVKARLLPGVSVPQAQAAMDQLADRLARDFPEYNEGRRITVFGADQVRIHPSIDGQLLPLSAGLMTLVGLVLLIACSNLANLLLVRGSARAQDVSIRLALGASRARVLWHVLTESVLLALLGGAVGLTLAAWGLRVLDAADLPLPLPAALDLQLDTRVLLFTILLSFATGIVFGLLPGLRIARSDVVASLRDDVTVASSRRGGWNLRNLLVGGQIALSFLILMIAGLFVRSLARAEQIPAGFDPEPLATIATNMAYAGYSSTEAGPLMQQLRERIAALPGVESAALSTQLPVRGSGGSSTLVIESYTPPDGTGSVEVMRSVVGVGYFDTLGVPILYGRAFSQADLNDDAPVAVVSEAFGRAYYGTADAVGRRFRGQGSERWIDIIGVAGDVKVRDLTEPPTPLFYYGYRPGTGTSVYVIARTGGNPRSILQPMRDTLQQLDPDLSVSRLLTMRQHLNEAMATPRLGVRLLSVFGFLGLLLASLGLYAVVAFAVQRRTTELGIRMALGADRSRVIRLVVREVMFLVGPALLVGVAITWLVGPLIRASLYGVSATDPATLVGVAALLAGSGAIAAWLPARRAARVDPAVALRHD